MRETTRRRSVLAAPAAVVALTLAGCGGGSGDSHATASEQTSPPATQAAAGGSARESAGGSATDDSADERAVVIEVEVENGEVTPSGERVDVQVGEPIRFVVDSDVADSLHVHSMPEQSFRVQPGHDEQLELTLHQPGVVEVELHELGDVVVSLAVRP